MFSRLTIAFIPITLFLLFSFLNHALYGREDPRPLFCIGGGYLDGGCNHSGGVFQLDYKWGKYLWHTVRPQVNLTVPEFCSFFVGLGIGWEWHLTKKITLTPSFIPGVFYRGNGRNLGFPIEFRSAIELTYKLNNKISVGIQASHISNAHLSHRNPGMNAYVVFFAFPLTK